MPAVLEQMLSALTPANWAMIGVGSGVALTFFGIAGAVAGKDPVLRRLEAQGARRGATRIDRGLLRHAPAEPRGLWRTLVPADAKERTQVQRQLAQAGMRGPHALLHYYLMRVLLGLVLPSLLLGVIAASRAGVLPLPDKLAEFVASLDRGALAQVVAVLVGLGFFGPAYWLRARAANRQRAIEDSFPNALDLIQISVQAGLGLDAAMIRVGNELSLAAPEIAEEFLLAQREIQAGRNRDRALIDMADRTHVEEVRAFVNVVLQSIQFGTNISDVLTTYAQEMRQHRELRAQEKANKLPVQMSAVMASLMLPALVMLTIGPVALRYIRFFGH